MKELFEGLKCADKAEEMRFTPFLKEYEPSLVPAPDRREALRYAGIPGFAQESSLGEDEQSGLLQLYDETLRMTVPVLTYRVSWILVPLALTLWEGEEWPVLPFEQHSRALRRNLQGCRGAVLFAATIGAGMDRLIRRYERTQPARGILLQGIGAERVEALCELFYQEVSAQAELAGLKSHHRFSPGYGDLPLDVQPQFLSLLDARRRLGITLNASCLMSPSKSVTAVIGIG